MYIYIYTCMHACMYVYVCMYVRMYVCMHVCVYVCNPILVVRRTSTPSRENHLISEDLSILAVALAALRVRGPPTQQTAGHVRVLGVGCTIGAEIITNKTRF